MVTKVEIVQRENKISTVRTENRTDTPLNNVTARIIMGNKERTFTRRVTKKRSSGRKIYMKKKKERERLISLKSFITTSSSLATKH